MTPEKAEQQAREIVGGQSCASYSARKSITTALLSAYEEGKREGNGLGFADLADANRRRQELWCPDQKPDLSFRGNELAGETGEVCNVIKKLERARQGWKGSTDTLGHLAEELADVVIVADLIAGQCGLDLGAAVAAKFNDTSHKHGFRVFMPAPAKRSMTRLCGPVDSSRRGTDKNTPKS